MANNNPYPGKVSPGDIFNVFREHQDSVLSTSEIATEIDFAHRSTVRRELNQMVEDDKLKNKKAGENNNAGVVWYPPDELPEIPQPTPSLLILIYTFPWFSLFVGGLISAGLGFVFFVPGIVGDAVYLGLVSPDWLAVIGLSLYALGLGAIYVGSIVMIFKFIYAWLRNRRWDTDE